MTVLQNSINANSTSPLSTTQGGSGASAPTAHGILVAEGASAVNSVVLTNGELLIGSTGADPVGAVLTSTGSTVTITNAAGSINLEVAAPSGESWTNITTTTATIAPSNGYSVQNAALVTLTLPSTAAYGTIFEVTSNTLDSGGWLIAQNAGQSIQFGNLVTTTGTGGSLASGSGTVYASVRILCTTANTVFQVINSNAEINVT